eukprot:1250881-Rhodomonas_salina.1
MPLGRKQPQCYRNEHLDLRLQWQHTAVTSTAHATCEAPACVAGHSSPSLRRMHTQRERLRAAGGGWMSGR